jgi:hypothetical protein
VAIKSVEGTQSSNLARTIPAADIPTLSEFNQIARLTMDQAHIDFLATSIALEGQHDPCLVRLGPDNRPQLWGGRHRKAAILKINSDLPRYNSLRADAGLPEIKEPGLSLLVIFRQATDPQIIQATFSENTTLPYSVMDLAIFALNLQQLAQAQGREITHAQIAIMMSTSHKPINASRVSTLLNLTRAPYKLQLALHSGKKWMREAVLQSLLKLGKSAQELEDLALKLETGQIKPSEMLAQAADLSRAKGKKIQHSMADLKRKLGSIDPQSPIYLTPGEMLDWLAGDVEDSIWGEAKETYLSEHGGEESVESASEGEYILVNGKPKKVA